MSSRFVEVPLVIALIALASCSRSPAATAGTADAFVAVDGSRGQLGGKDATATADLDAGDLTSAPDLSADGLDASEIADAATDSWSADETAPPPDQAELEIDSGSIEPLDTDGDVSVPEDVPGPVDTATLDSPPTSDIAPSPDSGTTPDTDTIPDLSAGPDGKCKDWRVRGDNKSPGDMCWNPPNHYCSSPWEAQLMWFGCKPDFSVCCNFYTQCRQCDWKKCPALQPGDPAPGGALAGCPDGDTLAAMKSQPDLCKPYLPNFEDKFCYDDAPPEWSTMLYHYFDGL